MDIAIASGKGGTGKTTLAVNLAAYLHSKHTQIKQEFVLTDLDVEEPNSGLFIKGDLVYEQEKFRPVPHWIEEKCSLCGNCQKICQFNAIAQLPNTLLIYPELCHSCYACSELCPEQALPMASHKIGVLKHYKLQPNPYSLASFHFIESRLRVGEPSGVNLIKQTKEYVKAHFPANSIIIFDCPPGTSCPVIEAVKNVHYTMLVTEPTPFGLYDLKLAVETMKKLQNNFGVVINRNGIGNDDVEKYCAAENIQILAKIPYDREIAELIAKGELVIPHLGWISKTFEDIFKGIQINIRDFTTG
jgi:MinD superfamily P-loop ATPase